MEKEKLTVKSALKYLKAGYHLYSIISQKEERFLYQNNLILIVSEQKSLKLNEYDFLSLYRDSFFFLLDDSNEEVVDIKKDEEYYSWRQ